MGFVVKILLLTGVELAAAEVRDIHHSAPVEHFCTDIMRTLQTSTNAIQSMDKTHVATHVIQERKQNVVRQILH